MPLTQRSSVPFRLPGTPWFRPLPAALLVVLLVGLAVPAAAAAPARPAAGAAAGAGPVKPGYSRLVDSPASPPVLQPALADADARRAVFVQLDAIGAAQIWSDSLPKAGASAAARAVLAQRALVLALARRTTAGVPTATVLFTVTDAVPGVGLLASPAALRALDGQPGVVKVSAIVPKVPAADGSAGPSAPMADPLVGTLTGAGVRVGVIDTGVDFTHADLGGAGTPSAYAAARLSDTAGWQPTATVVAGYDFVGDSYDAASTTVSGGAGSAAVPRPDPNPLDCNGHGTRVAGAIAGSGTGAGGAVAGGFPGGDGDGGVGDPGQVPVVHVPSGVAPQASLYVFKIFGCAGSTDAVIPALDRALDPDQDGDLSDRLDVVSLSLANSTAAADDPETTVLDALARFGVLPVVAARQGADPSRASSLSGSVRALTVADSAQAPGADLGAGATAVAAGAAALIRQRQPAWTPEQVKAALVDTADPEVAGSSATTAGAGVGQRSGAGVMDVGAAADADVLAYSSTEPGAVSVDFGIVQADIRQEQVVATAAVVVQNTGAATAQLSLNYDASADQPGVSFEVSPASMAVLPGASTLATVTMTINPAALRRTPDDGTSPQQRNPLTGLDEARQYTASSRGLLLLTSAQGSVRVPVSAAVRPASVTAAADGTLAGGPALALSGTGFSLSSPGEPGSVAQQSLLSVLQLGYRSPALPPCPAASAAATSTCSADGSAADLQAVGVGRTPAVGNDPGYLWFGLATYRKLSAVGRDVLPTVDIDVDGDNTADYTLQVQAVAGTDLLYALLFDDRQATATLTAIYPVNFNLGDVDTNATDSNVVLIPVDPAALGYRPGVTTFPIRYSVSVYTAGGAPENAMAADVTPALAFDVAAPGLTTANPLWQDQGGVGVPYQLAPGSTGTDALVLHLHGSGAQQAQVLRLAG